MPSEVKFGKIRVFKIEPFQMVLIYELIPLNMPEVFPRYALLSCGSKEMPGGLIKAVKGLKEASFNAVSYISENRLRVSNIA